MNYSYDGETRSLHTIDGKFVLNVLVDKNRTVMPYLERFDNGTTIFISDNGKWICDTLWPALRDYLLDRKVTKEIEDFLQDDLIDIYSLLVVFEISNHLGWFDNG